MARRPRGTGSVYLRGKLYWIKFPKGSGAPIREPTGSRDRRVAERLLKTRVAEVANNKFKAKSKATIGDLVELAVKEQRALRRRSSGIVEARGTPGVPLKVATPVQLHFKLLSSC